MNQLRELLQAARRVIAFLPWMLRLLWRSHPGATALLILLTALQAVAPVGQLWVTKLLMDQMVLLLKLPAGQRSGEPVTAALLYLLLEGAIMAMAVMIGLLAGHARNVLQEHLVLHVQQKMLEQSARLDLEEYESPQYYDQLQRAQQQAGQGPVQLLGALLDFTQTAATLLSIGSLVLLYKPWMALVLAATTIPSFWALIHFGWRRYLLFDTRTPDGRRATYLSNVLTADTFAKEVRVWGLTGYFLEQILALHRRFRKENIDLSRGQALATLGGEMLSTAGYYGCYFVVLLGVIAGRLTLGEMTLYAGAFSRMQSLFESMLTAAANIFQLQLFAQNTAIFLALEPKIVAPSDAEACPDSLESLRIEGLSFLYPGTEERVLNGIDLTIRAGECVALVGANGAGKTTLVKLLLRLYEPTEGRIAVNTVDIRRLDPEQWRRRVGIVFQDYARFQLTVRENIGIGNIAQVDDLEVVRRAARAAAIEEVIENLPHGYETLLGRQFEGGCELSLGQWQRLALARALLRDAPLLVMDEPTAAMDPQSEHDLFRELRSLALGRMTLLVSHRFSTVRMADRIIVLEDGRIVEEGTHDELMVRDGRYAHLFRLQAESYQLPESHTETGVAPVLAGDDGSAERSALGLAGDR
jgi:ATP-binding cassette subfamily B protein